MPISQFGAFSEPGYLAVSDPYDKPKKGMDKLGAFKPGGQPKVLKYEGFDPLYVNEPYYDILSKPKAAPKEGDEVRAPGPLPPAPSPAPPPEPPGPAPPTPPAQASALRPPWRVQEKAPINPPFKPSHPMKKSVGLGDYFGTLGGTIEHIDDPAPGSRKMKGQVTHKQPNIKTNPCQKGTYGFVGTTLGERMGRTGKGVAGEYAYQSDPYSERLTKADVEARRQTFVPFKPASGYKKRGPGNPERELGKPYDYVPEEEGTKGQRSKFERPAVVPFKPSHPPRSGWDGTLGAYPGYVNDPVAAKLAATAGAAKANRDKANVAPWRPGGAPRGGPHPSIVQLNMSIKGSF